MSTMKHPEDEGLIAFLENPEDATFKTLSLHLALCQNCRNQMHALSKLQETLKEIATETAILVDETSLAEDNILEQEPQSLKAALHFATHSAAMDRALNEETEERSPEKQRHEQTSPPFSFAEMVQGWLRLRTPFWVTAPAAAFVAIVLIFFVSSPFSPDAEKLTIAPYQDNAVITFQEKTQRPGMGFFDKARTSVQTFDDIRVVLVEKTGIVLSWPPVENAMNYTLRLQMIRDGKKKTVEEITTHETEAVFQKEALEKNTRYEWRLSGKTQDEKTFQASGGFVVTFTN